VTAADPPTYRLDGASFDDLEGFYDEVGDELLRGAPWGRSIEALHEVLAGNVPPVPRTFRLVWEHADLSRRRLGGSGPGSFAALIDVVTAHPNVELILS
jgi:RNAse (barnase) inhibitor barstar